MVIETTRAAEHLVPRLVEQVAERPLACPHEQHSERYGEQGEMQRSPEDESPRGEDAGPVEPESDQRFEGAGPLERAQRIEEAPPAKLGIDPPDIVQRLEAGARGVESRHGSPFLPCPRPIIAIHGIWSRRSGLL